MKLLPLTSPLISDTTSRAHQWLAITTGAMADFVGLKEKLDCGGKFKSGIVEAIKLDPSDGVSHHLYGRWCLEVAGLSYFTKMACAKLIGTPPESTYEEALACFLKAEEVISTKPYLSSLTPQTCPLPHLITPYCNSILL